MWHLFIPPSTWLACLERWEPANLSDVHRTAAWRMAHGAEHLWIGMYIRTSQILGGLDGCHSGPKSLPKPTATVCICELWPRAGFLGYSQTVALVAPGSTVVSHQGGSECESPGFFPFQSRSCLGSWVCHKIMRWTYGSPGTFPLVSIISKSPVGAKMLQTCCLPSDWFQFQHLSTDSVFLHTYVLQRTTNSHVTALVFLLDSAHGSDTSRSFKDLSLILVLVLKIGHSLRLSPQKLSGRTSTSSLTLPCRSFTLAGKTANVNFTLPGKWTWLVELMNDTLFPPVSAILMWPWYDKLWLWVKPLVAWWSLVGVNKIGQLETSADPGVRILCHGVDLGAWLARLSETSQGGKLNQNNEHPNGSKWLIVIYTYLHKLFTPISGKAGDCWCKQWFHHIRIFVASKTLPRSPPSTQMAESWLWKRPWFFSMTLWVQLGWNKWMVKQMDDKCHQLGDVGV